MSSKAITLALAACNGGPGLTAQQLAERLGQPLACVRQQMAQLVFTEGVVTCDRAGRYKLGDPAALLFAE